MKLELKEHEIEQAIETFISSFVTNFSVKVKGFDLQGMRSKDGLSAIVDFDVEGVSNLREIKTESSNVKPTNTAWRDELESKEKSVQLNIEPVKTDTYYKVLELLGSNPLNKNRAEIESLIDHNIELQESLSHVALFQDWLAQCVKEDATQMTAEVSPLAEEESDMKILQDSNELSELETNDEKDTPHPALVASIAPDSDEDSIIFSKPTSSILDEVTQPEEEQQTTDNIVTQSLFGKPLDKPHRKLFG